MKNVCVAATVTMVVFSAILTGIINSSTEPWIQYLIAAFCVASSVLAIVSSALYAGMCAAVEFIEYGSGMRQIGDAHPEKDDEQDSL